VKGQRDRDPAVAVALVRFRYGQVNEGLHRGCTSERCSKRDNI
jgi:hypothetical protein